MTIGFLFDFNVVFSLVLKILALNSMDIIFALSYINTVSNDTTNIIAQNNCLSWQLFVFSNTFIQGEKVLFYWS